MSIEEMKIIKDGLVFLGVLGLFAWMAWLEHSRKP